MTRKTTIRSSFFTPFDSIWWLTHLHLECNQTLSYRQSPIRNISHVISCIILVSFLRFRTHQLTTLRPFVIIIYCSFLNQTLFGLGFTSHHSPFCEWSTPWIHNLQGIEWGNPSYQIPNWSHPYHYRWPTIICIITTIISKANSYLTEREKCYLK